MGLVTPDIGLVFWTTLSFLIVLFLLKKMAWKPILESLKEREDSITEALETAEKARMEMDKLKSDNEQLLRDARDERDAMLKEAREIKDKMIADAKEKAQEEADRLTANARENINNEKMAAMAELKNQVANLSIEIAERLLKEELSNADKQKNLTNRLVEEVSLN